MKTKIIEATNGPRNWGKFLVGKFDIEWKRRSEVATDLTMPLLGAIGWSDRHIHVLDLQTGEGAVFGPWGSASADLNKHKIWVCPLFEPFLIWLYEQSPIDLDKLPDHVDLPKAEFAMSGFRRKGPDHAY